MSLMSLFLISLDFHKIVKITDSKMKCESMSAISTKLLKVNKTKMIEI